MTELYFQVNTVEILDDPLSTNTRIKDSHRKKRYVRVERTRQLEVY